MYTITVNNEMDFDDLVNACWSGATDTLNTIRENDKEDEFMCFLARDAFSDIPSLTEINDLLWFDSEWVFDMLGISEEDDDEEEEEDDEEDENWDDEEDENWDD